MTTTTTHRASRRTYSSSPLHTPAGKAAARRCALGLARADVRELRDGWEHYAGETCYSVDHGEITRFHGPSGARGSTSRLVR